MSAWTPVGMALPPDGGWYLVMWRSLGDDHLFVECSDYCSGSFSDRWGSNAEPIAWMPLPEAYKP